MAVALSLALAGCAALAPQRGGELPPLPPLAALSCCWLSQEQVTLDGDHGKQALLTAVERKNDQLTVVVLDATGRRLLALRYDDRDGLRQLTAPPSWDSRYSGYLLTAIFLHHAEAGRWRHESSEWLVQAQGAHKSLTRRGRPAVTLDYSTPADGTGQPRVLRIPGSDFSLAVATLSRSAL